MQSKPPPDQPQNPSDAAALGGTKLQIVEAALQTLKTRGFAGASARAIAGEGDFNQALIFYHFGSVRNALLAVLNLIGARRMEEYGPAFERAATAPELVALARTVYEDDLQRGYITVLGEMVSGGVTDPSLGAEVAACIEPWIEMVEHKIQQLLAGTFLQEIAPPRDLAFALVALYFGADMLSHLQRDSSRVESLLDLSTQLSTLAQGVLRTQQKEAS